ncbi:MAG TPA: 6-bladed beta-propeller, partial [Bacteroidales bacterium]|nr:6-bladed beta-propeller [Bacteroidales bacterium]
TLVNDRLYILDRGINRKIFIFDCEGHYLGSVGNYGRGPGEFIGLVDFIIDDKKGQLWALDAEQRKVLIFNLQNGKFLNDFKIHFLSTDFEKLDDNTLSFYSKFPQVNSRKSYSIAIMNLKDKSYKWFLEQDEYDTPLSGSYAISHSTNTYYAPYLKDIVFRITKNGVEPGITFDFGQNKIPREKIKNTHGNTLEIIELLEKDEKGWAYGIENVFETDQFITFNLKLERSHLMVIYSKSSANYYYGNRYEGGLEIFRLISNIAVNDNQFFGVINAYFFERAERKIMEQEDIELIREYRQALDALSDESNPIIISIEYNNF